MMGLPKARRGERGLGLVRVLVRAPKSVRRWPQYVIPECHAQYTMGVATNEPRRELHLKKGCYNRARRIGFSEGLTILDRGAGQNDSFRGQHKEQDR